MKKANDNSSIIHNSKISLNLNLRLFFLLYLTCVSSHAANFSSNFESTNFSTIQTFTITSGGLTASFTGGTSFTIGNGALYHSGTKSWMIDPAGSTNRGISTGTGSINLPDDVERIDFYIRTSNANSTGQVQIIDSSDAIIEDITSSIVSNSWLHIEKQITTGSPAIKSVIVNAFGSDMLAIDDLSFSTPLSSENGNPETDTVNNTSSSSSSSGGYFFLLPLLLFFVAKR